MCSTLFFQALMQADYKNPESSATKFLFFSLLNKLCQDFCFYLQKISTGHTVPWIDFLPLETANSEEKWQRAPTRTQQIHFNIDASSGMSTQYTRQKNTILEGVGNKKKMKEKAVMRKNEKSTHQPCEVKTQSLHIEREEPCKKMN